MNELKTAQRNELRENLGKRVRALRRKAGLTLQAASEQTGLAPSTLSKIENGQMSPTYENLVRIASGYRIELEGLLANRSPTIATARYTLTRKGEGKQLSTDEYLYEMLCTSISQKRIIPLVATIKRHEFLGPQDFGMHEGEEMVYVLSGSVDVHLEHYEPITLNEGDCAYFDSTMGHALISSGSDEAKVFWVCTHAETIE